LIVYLLSSAYTGNRQNMIGKSAHQVRSVEAVHIFISRTQPDHRELHPSIPLKALLFPLHADGKSETGERDVGDEVEARRDPVECGKLGVDP